MHIVVRMTEGDQSRPVVNNNSTSIYAYASGQNNNINVTNGLALPPSSRREKSIHRPLEDDVGEISRDGRLGFHVTETKLSALASSGIQLQTSTNRKRDNVTNDVALPPSSRRENSIDRPVDDDDGETSRDGLGFHVTETNLNALATGTQLQTSTNRKREIEFNRSMETKEKKRRVLASYVTTEVKLPKLDRYEVLRIKTYVRETIFKNCKFVKGEGAFSVPCRQTRRAIKALKQRYGNSHMKIDLVSDSQTCYAKKIMNYENISSDTHTWYEIGMWWRLWAPVVRDEIRRVRAAKGYLIKRTIQKSEFS